MYRKHHIDQPSRQRHSAPGTPRVASIRLLPIDLPAAELLVQPPTIRTVPHLDIRQPFCDDGNNGCVEPDTDTWVG